ncbi:MAG: DMT family transporter [Anaerolineales bacterium]|nr:DMT family transporter [Anaerolineales bacterium]
MTSNKDNRANPYLPYLALASGILALSFSAMFVRWAEAPGPITGFYRVFLSSLLLSPFFVRDCQVKCKINRQTILFPVLAGLFTSGDFALWNTSVHYTTAANATLLGNTAPLWVALGAWLLFRERLNGRFWLGLLLALAGATLILGTDFLLHPRLGIGDLMAIGTGMFYGGYFLSTQRSRQHFNPLTHLWLMGVSASFGLLVINLALGNPISGYSSQSWLVFFLTAIVSQIIGYFSLTYALGHLPAAVVSPTMIGQPIMTAILAIPLLGEIPTLLQITGGIIALAGIYIVNQAYNQSRQIMK